MPKYLFPVSYSVDGAKGLVADGGTKRLEAINTAIEGLGGSVESFYYAHGEYDGYLIADLPNETAATSLSLTVAAAGGARVKTVPLFTPAELDEAAKASVQYTAPGK